ncbi:MAG TPA: CvpA family protein [Candidatus Megaira endosymbiont of Nemacystus decipiens]|nr:CvpA family protein [Candidatus Megaera endosymbiont of Nemacystus decipiens]
MSVTFFDIIILSLITISTLLGFYRGFFYILIDNLGFILTIILTIILAPYLEPKILPYFKNELLNSIISYVITYIVLSLVISFILSRAQFAFMLFKVSILNTFFGGVLGVVRGGILSLIIFAFTVVFSTGSYLNAKNLGEVFSKIDKEKYPGWLENSLVKNPLNQGLFTMINLFSKDYLESIKMPLVADEDDTSDDAEENNTSSFMNEVKEGITGLEQEETSTK